MKYKSLLIISLSTLLMVAGCNRGSNIDTTTSSTITNTTSSTTSSNKEEYQVILSREIDGVEVSISNSTPIEGEKVRIFVTNKMPGSIRITNVEVNDVSLEGFNTNVKNCKAYDFVMPSNSNAVINIEVADVYLVTVANNVQSILSLAGIGDGLFLEGEEVTFTPTTYAGYWYKDVTLVDADVDLVKNNDGSYSFTMPNHTVTVTAKTGVNYYRVNYAEGNVPYVFSFENGKSFAFGELVKFKVNSTNPDIMIEDVSIENINVEYNDGEYSFTMPSYPIYINVETKQAFKSLAVTNSTHFNATLKTIFEENEVEVSNNNVISNQKIYVDVFDNGNEENHNMIVDKIEIYGGNSMEDTNDLIGLATKEGERFVFFTNPEYMFYNVVILEKEPSKQLLGEFTGVTLSNNYSVKTLTFLEDGKINKLDYSEYSANVISAEEPYHYTIDMWGYIYEFFAYVSPNKDAILEVGTGYTYNNQFSANTYDYSLSFFVDSNYTGSTSSDINVFSVISCDDPNYVTEYYGEFILFTKNDESIITCYYDFVAKEVYWNVNYTITGKNGKTEGDSITITSVDGNPLANMLVSSKARGYQHKATIQ